MRPLLHLLALLLSISCIAQKKPIVIRDTVEIAVMSKNSKDDIIEKQKEFLITATDQLEKGYTAGYIVVSVIIAVFGLIIAILTGWGFIIVHRFKKQKNALIKEFKEDTQSFKAEIESDFKNSLEEKTGEFSSLISSVGVAIEVLSASTDPQVLDVIRRQLDEKGGVILTGTSPRSMDSYQAILRCSGPNCIKKFFSTTLSMIDQRNMHTRIAGGRPPVERTCPQCGHRNLYFSRLAEPLPRG